MSQGHYKGQLQGHILIATEDGRTGYVNIKCSVLNNFHVFSVLDSSNNAEFIRTLVILDF